MSTVTESGEEWVTAAGTFSKPTGEQHSVLSDATRRLNVDWRFGPTGLRLPQLADFYAAIRQNNLSKLESAFNDGVNLHALPTLGRDALQLAVQCRNQDAVRLLLQAGADPSAQDKNGKTSLHWAASTDWDSGIMKLLLSETVNVSAKDHRGQTVLHHAARKVWARDRKLEALQLLLNENIDISAQDDRGRTALHLAVYLGNELVTKLLLIGNPELMAKDSKGRTVLHLATMAAIELFARLLLRETLEGLSPPSIQGSTLLHHEGWGWSTHDAIAKSLLDAGASKLAQDQFGRVPVLRTEDVHSRIRRMVHLITTGGVSLKQFEGSTILHLAAAEGSEVAVKLSLSFGADILSRDKRGSTPLHEAAKVANDVKVVKVLLDWGSDVSARDWEGLRPIDLTGYDDVFRLLAEVAGAKDNFGLS